MKIALVSSQYPRQTGTFIQREINGLREAGVDVHVFSIYPKNKNIFNDHRVLSTLEDKDPLWHKVNHLNGTSISYQIALMKTMASYSDYKDLNNAFKQYYKQGFTSLAKYIYSIPKAFYWSPIDESFDHIISFWGNYSATVAYFIAKRSNLPFSTFLHAGTDLYRDRAFLLEKLLFTKNIICNCQFNIDYLKKCYPEKFGEINKKIIMHRIGLDLSRYNFSAMDINSKEFKICCIGGLEKYKGPINVLMSFYKFLNSGHEGYLTFCGSGPLMNELIAKAKALLIAEKVIFKGVCPVDEVNKVLNDSHLIVHASPSIGDAVPTVLQEAAAMGRPAIASNIAGIPELLIEGKTGILVEPNDINAITEAMIFMNKNRDICKKMGLKGRELAEKKFNLWKNTKTLIQELKT